MDEKAIKQDFEERPVLGFVPTLAKALQWATAVERTALEQVIAQGGFYHYVEDLALLAYLSSTIEDENGRRFGNIDEIIEGTRQPDNEELPGILAGLRMLEQKGFIFVRWAVGGVLEKQPFWINITDRLDDLRRLLDDLHEAFSQASLVDLKHLKLLFHDHPRLYQEILKLGVLLYIIAGHSGSFSVPAIVEAFGLDRKEGKPGIIGALEYLKKERLIEIQWTDTDSGIVNVDRIKTLFNIENEGGI